jgi:hypothetical protein
MIICVLNWLAKTATAQNGRHHQYQWRPARLPTFFSASLHKRKCQKCNLCFSCVRKMPLMSRSLTDFHHGSAVQATAISARRGWLLRG